MIRRIHWITPAALLLTVWGAVWIRAQQVDSRVLSSLLPSGAILYLEAKDFNGLLTQWNSSRAKKAWLSSENFGVLSRSRLIQRLGEAQDQFATAAGIPVELNLINEVAGDRTAFAFYDLAALKFIYLTRVDSSRLNASRLWKLRTRYQQRSVTGIPFYISSNGESHRTVGFASFRDWLVIGTAEDQIARTLALLAGNPAAPLSRDSWFTNISLKTAAQGNLRLVYDLDALRATPQFRTYWLQQSVSELKQFTSGVADLSEIPNGFEENRILLRRSAGAAGASSASSLARVLQYAPSSASLYRAWAMPDRNLLNDTLQQVVLAQAAAGPQLNRLAPSVSVTAPDTGSETDFETRIDRAPFRKAQSDSVADLTDAVTAMQPTALLHIQSTTLLNDQVFVMPQSGLVIECQRPDLALLQKALASDADILRSGSLDPLSATLSGNALVVTRLPIAPSGQRSQLIPGTTYTAVFNREFEWPHFKQLFNFIDRTAASPETKAAQNAPAFFSGNVRSLGDTLSRLLRASITRQESIGSDGIAQVHETIHYELSPP